jgi:subtilisin family serine protease
VEAQAVASWLVTLEGPSVFARYAAAEGLDKPGARQRDAAATVARAAEIAPLLARFEQQVVEQQVPVVAAVEASGARVISRYTTAANGLLLHATAAQAQAVGRIAGVTRIELAPLVRPLLGQSVPHIGATALAAELGYDGSDSVVAVIDTGVDYTHGHLGGPGTVAAFQAAAAQRETITDTWEGVPLYPSAKVIGGWDFVGPRYNPPHICTDAMMANGDCTNVPEPDADPLDGASHGTHVSGISAGEAVANLADGVAPGASLVGLKLYGLGGADEAADLLVDAIEWVARVNLGLEDRGVLPPRVDAVNISLGEIQAIASELFDDAVEAAVGAGAIVVASAGNDGNRPYVTGSPSASPHILSVASSVPPAVFLEIQADWVDGAGVAQQEGLPAIESSIALPLAQVEPLPLVAPLAWFGRACVDDVQEQEVTERIALVARGECTFREKLLRVQEAGAAGVVMFTDNRAKSAMGGDGAGLEIPAVMIDNEPGEVLRDRVTSGTAVTITIDPERRVLDVSNADAISGFSSRGPSRTGALKPDITGPGSSILSAARGSGSGGSSSSGTSMSGPHLAGAAAVVQQRNRVESLGLGAGEMAALLMNYARPVIRQDDDVAPVSRQGAGRVDLMGAGTGDLLVTAGDIASLNIGAVAADGPTQREHSLSLRNLGAEDMRVALRAEYLYSEDADKGLTLGLPDGPVMVAAGASVDVPVVVDIDPDALAPWALLGSAGNSADDVQRAEIDGYVLLGAVDENGDPIADTPQVSVPFRALPRRASRVTALSLAPLLAASPTDVRGEAGALRLANRSPYTGTAEIFLLPFDGDGRPAGIDPNEPEVALELDLRAVGVRFEPATQERPEGMLSFGLALHEVASIPQQAITEILLDVNNDGQPDHRIRASASRDRMVTRYAAWDAAAGAITGTEETTGTVHVADVHGRIEMLSVPLSAVGLQGPAPIAFSVVRSGAHEDWRHVGVPDALPDAASGEPIDAWSHWRVSPAELARVPSRWSVTLAGNASVSLPLSAEGAGSIDPELLLLYPNNDFALEAGVVGGQIQPLHPTPRALLLPLLLGEHVLGDD